MVSRIGLPLKSSIQLFMERWRKPMKKASSLLADRFHRLFSQSEHLHSRTCCRIPKPDKPLFKRPFMSGAINMFNYAKWLRFILQILTLLMCNVTLFLFVSPDGFIIFVLYESRVMHLYIFWWAKRNFPSWKTICILLYILKFSPEHNMENIQIQSQRNLKYDEHTTALLNRPPMNSAKSKEQWSDPSQSLTHSFTHAHFLLLPFLLNVLHFTSVPDALWSSYTLTHNEMFNNELP